MTPDRVAVTVPTYRRPEGLTRLLEGLRGQRFAKTAPPPQVTVNIVDNDPDAAMRSLVQRLAPGFPWRVVYACEPARGLAHVRNRLLAMVAPESDYIAFIDDDEVPEPHWLDELLAVIKASGAGIVQGPIKPVFERPPAAWIARGGFFETGPFADGAPRPFAATNNTLIKAEIVLRHGLRFDPHFNHTGGEDEHFFGRAQKLDFPIVTAANALVQETIPARRTNLSYLLQRKFRMGNTLSQIDRLEAPGVARQAVRLAKGLGRIGRGGARLLLALPRPFEAKAAALGDIAWGAGSLAGLFGLSYREYRASQLNADRRPAAPAS